MSMRLVAQTQDVKNDLSNENIKAHHNTTEQSLFRHHTNVAQFLLTDRQTELEEKKSAISSCYQKFLLLCILEHCENFLLFFIIFFLVTCLFMWNRPEPWFHFLL